LSRELHDQTAQDITTLSLGLKTIEDSNLERESLKEEIQKLQKITSILGHKIHQIAFELRPSSIDDLGLLQTLQSYTFEWSKENGIPVELETISSDKTDIPLSTSINVFRIVQEAFNNILKHAQATRVSLIYEQKPEIIKIVLEDDGIGVHLEQITSANSGKQLGLLGMKERAEIAGGTLTIESGQNKGTTVFLSIPLGQ
ncbi:MAG: histidine kinase, partial [Chloroflexi bacterium]